MTLEPPFPTVFERPAAAATLQGWLMFSVPPGYAASGGGGSVEARPKHLFTQT